MPNHIHTELPGSESSGEKPSPIMDFVTSRGGIVTAILLAIAAFLLLQEHWAHALGFLPYLLILACPLMHIFMHGGHGGHGHSSASRKEEERS